MIFKMMLGDFINTFNCIQNPSQLKKDEFVLKIFLRISFYNLYNGPESNSR